ncbi:MAG: hypothetical protein P4L66_01790 [Acetobacteraceae bacterium]|nr:hypothetical protein [Acetobacteraceae bacterium]
MQNSDHHDRSHPAPTRLLRAEAFAWLGTTLLLLNLVAAAVMPPHIAAAAGWAGAIEICSSEGMIWVDASGHRLKQGGTPTHTVECQFCLPLLHAAFGPAIAPELPPPGYTRHVRGTVVRIGHQAAVVCPSAAQPRAPPDM